MKYKAGDKVRIKSLDWYNENKDNYGAIYAGNGFCFWKNMSRHCGEIMKITIVKVDPEDSNKGYYFMENCEERWTDGMIEGLVEEATEPELKFNDEDKIHPWTIQDAKDGDVIFYDDGWTCIFKCIHGIWFSSYCFITDEGEFHTGYETHAVDSTVNGNANLATKEQCDFLFQKIEEAGYKWNPETKTLEKLIEPLDVPTMTTDFVKEHGLPCPEGYIFKDENGNVINATKIVLEKKKKEYPKTYEECCNVLGISDGEFMFSGLSDNEYDLFDRFVILKRCRDAYWKIAGEEMGLGKPWKPDWRHGKDKFYCICTTEGEIVLGEWYIDNKILAFPTPEMRDAFKENFDPDIEICKELL